MVRLIQIPHHLYQMLISSYQGKWNMTLVHSLNLYEELILFQILYSGMV